VTQSEMLSEIDHALRLVQAAQATYPGTGALAVVGNALRTLMHDVEQRWPLEEGYAEQMLLGRYAVRNLEPDFPNLVDRLIRLEMAVANK
jgi:hypothetical protein